MPGCRRRTQSDLSQRMDSCLRWHFLRCLAFELDHPHFLGVVPINWGREARRWLGH